MKNSNSQRILLNNLTLNPISIFLVWIIFFFTITNVNSQSHNGTPQIRSWVKLKGQKKKIKSYIHKIENGGVHFINKNRKLEGQQYEYYGFDQIESIGIKKKGKVLKSILIGGFVGASIGVATGYISGDDDPCRYRNLGEAVFCAFSPRFTAGQKATAAGIGLGITGAAIGGIVSAFKGRISLNKKSKKYKKDMDKLRNLKLYK